MTKKAGLNAKQERFCQEYMIDLNATQAAMRCKFTKSDKSASVIGARLLGNVRVSRRIEELKAGRAQRTQVTSDLVLMELMKLATVDIGLAFTKDGDLKPIQDIPEDVRRAIAGIEIFAERDWVKNEDDDDDAPAEKEVIGYNKKIKFWDKTRALELLGKHLKLFTDKVHVTGATLADLVMESQGSDKSKEK